MQTVDGLVAALAAEVEAGRYASGDPLVSIRILAHELGCATGTVARAYQRLRAVGVVSGRPRSVLRVGPDGASRARALLRGDGPLRLTGSDDPALDVLVNLLGDGVALVAGGRGSVTGLGLLARGAADAAAMHLLHTGTGKHNDDFVRAVAGVGPITLVHLWLREQVLVLPPGNPARIQSITDLAGCRLAWRDSGTGSRLLLERLLRVAGVDPAPDRGVTADSHLGVAVAVVTGAADAGLCARAAAEPVGADWLPVTVEPFELAIRADAVGAARSLLDVLDDPAFRARVQALPGYDLSRMGEMRGAA